jgi:hypothetical protein
VSADCAQIHFPEEEKPVFYFVNDEMEQRKSIGRNRAEIHCGHLLVSRGILPIRSVWWIKVDSSSFYKFKVYKVRKVHKVLNTKDFKLYELYELVTN